jgi:hypothetical protein
MYLQALPFPSISLVKDDEPSYLDCSYDSAHLYGSPKAVEGIAIVLLR